MTISFDYRGNTVLVSGGSQGIGLAVAQAFATAGANVHVTGTRAQPSEYDGDLLAFSYHQVRMQDASERSRLASRIGALDILINNAGMARDDEYSEEGYREVIEVNLNAVVDLTYRFKDRLAAARGAIVNVGSVGSFIGLRDRPAYTASKAGLLGFTRSIADMWAKDGIRVNMVAPAFVETQIIEWARRDEDMHKAFLKSIPARRFGRPEEVANVVLFLAAPETQYVRGQSLGDRWRLPAAMTNLFRAEIRTWLGDNLPSSMRTSMPEAETPWAGGEGTSRIPTVARGSIA